MSFEKHILEQIKEMLHCDGIVHVEQYEEAVTAWIADLVKGKDWKVPVLIHFIPTEQPKDKLPEHILQICFTLSRKVNMEDCMTLARKLNELNTQSIIGSLHALPHGEILYLYRMAIVGESPERTMEDFSFSIQLMLTFLFEFYPYILVLSADSSQLTLQQYLDAEV